ncbi:intermembrane phospholipid transport protein YdbH family protein [Brevundimonas lenta]|uniref:C4-dicarboxylate ABC transporter n=1 Tax=Brevundimonas lenta TaxID=424796 RepID=A0A7W6JBY3_9CAUL|nr:hypothetical protein [Brevundimonas lenta]
MLLILGVVLGVLLILLAAAWLNRRMAARQVLIGWLEQQGVPADMEVERVELDRLVARIRIGDPARPDVTVERVEVDYVIGSPFSKRGLGVTPSRVRLVRPVVRASVRGGKLSLGSLDPLIEKFMSRPPQPDVRGPLVLVEGARVRLDTDYGPANILGDARIDNGELRQLNARMPATAFRSGDIEARDLAATLVIATTGDRMAIRGTANASSANLPALSGEALQLNLTGNFPYPDLKARRGDGWVRVVGALTAGQLTAGDRTAADAVADLTFTGQSAGWLEAFRIEGVTDADLRADRLEGPNVASALRLRLDGAQTSLMRDSRGLGWRLEGGAVLDAGAVEGVGLDASGLTLSTTRLVVGGRGSALEAQGPFSVTADRLRLNELRLDGARGALDLDLVSDNALRLEARGSLRATRGAWPLFGAPARDDAVELADMKRALSDFAVDIPAVSISATTSETRVVLDRPATLRPANGGVLTVSPSSGPIFAAVRGAPGGGALSVSATPGAGLPDAAISIPAWRLTPGGFTATIDGRAALDFDVARGVTLSTSGELASSNGRLTYVANGCMPLTVERLELDENDVTDISGDFCPSEAPMISVVDGAWRADGILSDVDADAPFLAMSFRDARGSLTATGGPRGLGLDARVARARVVDATTPERFNPVTAVGSARLSNENWTGAFDLSRGETDLGTMTVTHNGREKAGGLTIDAPSIIFSVGGLQPEDLSPVIAGFVGSPASGSVSFAGRVDWRDGAEGTSGGRLTIPGLNFNSPAGPITGLQGTVDFTSLAPLTAEPGQVLTAERLDSFAPLTDVDLTFGLDKSAVTIQGGDLDLAGGVIRVEPFAVPFDHNQPIAGVVVLENVQLGDVVAGSGLNDKVALDAVVSGRLPFTYDPQGGVRITGGSLQAIKPGRLSIQREALSGLQADGGGEGVPPNTVQDLAYQAMENLSFDILSAEVNSLDQGRLGILFRIRGRHDPPTHQELRIPISEFISREFLNRQLPLPSGTEIDLTLDTTINLNELIGDLMELNRARAGKPTPTPYVTP